MSWRVSYKELKGAEFIFDWLQLKVTGMPETHSSIVMDIATKDRYYEFEATTTVRISRTSYSEKVCTIFKINAPREILEEALDELINEQGKIYNIPQTLYFGFRRIMEFINIDVRRWPNPLGWLFLICSELVYLFLKKVAEKMQWLETIHYLNQWRKDTVHSGDIRVILDFMSIYNRSEIVIGE